MSKPLSVERKTLLTAVLDRLIPAEGDMPGAGQAGVAEYIDQAGSSSPRLAGVFAEALNDIDSAAAQRGECFGEIPSDEQMKILRSIESDNPTAFGILLAAAYNGYYSNLAVNEALGLEARAPQPKGYEVEFGDFDSLKSVIARGRVYREA